MKNVLAENRYIFNLTENQKLRTSFATSTMQAQKFSTTATIARMYVKYMRKDNFLPLVQMQVVFFNKFSSQYLHM